MIQKHYCLYNRGITFIIHIYFSFDFHQDLAFNGNWWQCVPQANCAWYRKFLRSLFHFLSSCLSTTHKSQEVAKKFLICLILHSLYFTHLCRSSYPLIALYSPKQTWSFQVSVLFVSLTIHGAFPWAVWFLLFSFWDLIPGRVFLTTCMMTKLM